MMEGDLFLSAGSCVPSVDEVRARMRSGAELWQLLTSARRRACGVDVEPGEFLMPRQVVDAVVVVATGPGASHVPRWRVLEEMWGTHDTGNTPPWVRDYMAGVSGDKGGTYYEQADIEQRPEVVVPLRVVSSLHQALEDLSALVRLFTSRLSNRL